ncbi:unnamed protein product [Paramecium primaurelia]|uniref:Oxidation resistance protein 1 n=1 Tax=Paramecium primaurelia TaxID=5886 RepID=A0A8S1JZX5_PARPR|nr:unnamed protein product [Paramecium primaurelia]
MDFYQIAARNQLNSDSADYDIINIEYAGKDCPEYELDIKQDEFEGNLTNLPKEYLDNYQHQQENFIYYKVEMNDSIYGLELKFEISAIQILRLNNLSENSIYPGMTLKIPLKSDLGKPLEQNSRKFDSSIYPALYITQIGAIKGQFMITSSFVAFEPEKYCKQNDEIIFNAQIRDIENLYLQILLKHIVLVEQQELSQFFQKKVTINKNNVITIIAQTKKQKIVVVKLMEDNRIDEFLNLINQKLQDYYKNVGQEYQISQSTTEYYDQKTIIPYHFEMDGQMQNIEQPKQVICRDSQQTQLESKSEIVTRDKFISISTHLPILFKGQKWQCIYSSIQHGSSIQTLMRKTENNSPSVILIRDLDNYLFGAYLSDGIKNSYGKFYGNGESFLFTFKNSQDIKVYKWTHINNYITLCDTDGLAVGCGDKYGLFINSDLSNGYSCHCETFDNDVLSKNNKFVIERLEIWSISYN